MKEKPEREARTTSCQDDGCLQSKRGGGGNRGRTVRHSLFLHLGFKKILVKSTLTSHDSQIYIIFHNAPLKQIHKQAMKPQQNKK